MIKWLKLKIIKKSIQMLRDLDDDNLKREILSEAVKKLYNTISADEILRQEPNGVWIHKDRPLTGLEIARLKEEVVAIRQMKLLKILEEDIQYTLGKKIWNECRTKDDILWGQLITWMWDVIRTRIKTIIGNK